LLAQRPIGFAQLFAMLPQKNMRADEPIIIRPELIFNRFLN
jgi:hypothetical protein